MLDTLLNDLPPRALKTIKARQGDTLFRSGKKSSGLFRVLRGTVFLQRTTRSGDALILHRASAGDFFAEASIFSDTYHCDAICAVDSLVIRYGRRAILAIMHQDPAFASLFAQHLAEQVQRHRAHAEILAIRSAKQRIFAAVHAGYLQGRVTELAGRINLTHEACYRGLKALCDDGKLRRVGRGRYVLPSNSDHV